MRSENKFSGGKMTFGYDKDENSFFVPVEKDKEIARVFTTQIISAEPVIIIFFIFFKNNSYQKK